MKLNHLNLTVTDAAETAAFLQRYFDLRPLGDGPASATMAFLTDDQGMVLTLIRGKRGVEIQYPANFHIGFIQESEARVDEINRRLKEDGYDVPAPDRLHGSWTFYFQAPGGFTIEVLG
ncbi:MAG: glyoxalase family protein [Armatimonadetes bacterium]|jgi:catechol 2,3-dioxygenase-like lactoylglutathione lyase family enzyme|nr:glyoxalase family protein [Armatimonadota bacterium]